MTAVFDLPEEYKELQSVTRRLASEKIAPNAASADEHSEFPHASFDAWRRSGLIKALYPVEYGGDGGDTLAFAVIVEEIARACGSSSLFVLISRLAVTPVLRFGSPDLAARYVPQVVAGDSQASYCLSESNAGSDVASMATRAQRDGDHYVLNGTKAWITNAGVSDLYTVFAKTDPDCGSRGISAFVVERDFDGFDVGVIEQKMGMRGSPTGEIVMRDCVVPATNRIGDESGGFGYAMSALDGSRPIVGAQAVGLAQAALTTATEYVYERRQFSRRVSEFQGVQFMLADMATSLEAARTLVYRACAAVDAKTENASKLASMAKLYATDVAMSITTNAVQLLGGAGYTRSYPVERIMRDTKATQIYEGANQIQRIVIAKRLLDERDARGADSG